jgi:hypothetical protein
MIVLQNERAFGTVLPVNIRGASSKRYSCGGAPHPNCYLGVNHLTARKVAADAGPLRSSKVRLSANPLEINLAV